MTLASETLEEAVYARLLALKAVTATAESCSGGLIAHRLTNVPGASHIFAGGVVAYSNAVKHAVLGVDEEILAAEGAVSEPVARQMAEGVRTALDADYGVGVTGIAGPTGGTREKPVGLVYIAVAGPRGTVAQRWTFTGTRADIKAQTAEAALFMLKDFLA